MSAQDFGSKYSLSATKYLVAYITKLSATKVLGARFINLLKIDHIEKSLLRRHLKIYTSNGFE